MVLNFLLRTTHPGVTSLSVGMDDLNIHLTGGGAWLINFLIKLFKGTLRKTIASKVTDAATNAFATLFTNLQQKYPLALPMTGKLLEGTQFNTAMVPTGANGDAPFSINGTQQVHPSSLRTASSAFF